MGETKVKRNAVQLNAQHLFREEFFLEFSSTRKFIRMNAKLMQAANTIQHRISFHSFSRFSSNCSGSKNYMVF